VSPSASAQGLSGAGGVVRCILAIVAGGADTHEQAAILPEHHVHERMPARRGQRAYAGFAADHIGQGAAGIGRVEPEHAPDGAHVDFIVGTERQPVRSVELVEQAFALISRCALPQQPQRASVRRPTAHIDDQQISVVERQDAAGEFETGGNQTHADARRGHHRQTGKSVACASGAIGRVLGGLGAGKDGDGHQTHRRQPAR